ncbi:MAG: SH3 domain-containing protein [Treponema sp.]|jgi:hypothetical protein|nr:SH3 domain-containing protein [Treponema sp.]
MRPGKIIRLLGLPSLVCLLLLTACSRLGWGVLLWAAEDPDIPSGAVLPVYIRSNIDKVWVVGVPKAYQNSKDALGKIEVPLPRFELVGSKRKAKKWAAEFAPYAHVYAENLQDGLPIREYSDNGARRVYRLRAGEIIKIISMAEGIPAISASGEPLPGEWYKVLTQDGSTGFCFSYRLKLFDHYGGPLALAPAAEEDAADPDLDMLLAKVWSPESYALMVNSRRINLDELSRHWQFDPGQDTGAAHIYLPGLDRSFPYTAIRPDGERTWRFEGGNLQMALRSDTSLAVQFTEANGGIRTLLFTALPAAVDDLIMQESARREGLYQAIYAQGPVFTSSNYGTIIFDENGGFAWRGFDLLVPQVIPDGVEGGGRVSMDLFLGPSLEDRYNGAFTLHFNGGGPAAQVHFLYTLDNQGFRLEAAPESSMEGVTLTRRAASPLVLYFFRDTEPALFHSPEW